LNETKVKDLDQQSPYTVDMDKINDPSPADTKIIFLRKESVKCPGQKFRKQPVNFLKFSKNLTKTVKFLPNCRKKMKGLSHNCLKVVFLGGHKASASHH